VFLPSIACVNLTRGTLIRTDPSAFTRFLVVSTAHIFCRACLIGFLREKASPTGQSVSRSGSGISGCPDGECPCCNKTICSDKIIAVSKSKQDDGDHAVTTAFLSDLKSPPRGAGGLLQENGATQESLVAREMLESAIKGEQSSKMSSIMKELGAVWETDPQSKVLIFSHYLGFLDLLGSQLDSCGIEYLRLDGSLSLQDRMSVLEQFRSSSSWKKSSNHSLKQFCNGKSDSSSASAAPSDDEEPFPPDKKGRVLLMSMTAGGEGLNLVAASSVFICDPWWNRAKEDQCVNRIHRIGQAAAVVRVRKFVVAGTVEERIVELQGRKQSVADEVYKSSEDTAAGAAGKGGAARLTHDDFKLIFSEGLL